VRRGSGGPEVRIGPATVHIALALAHPGALVPCDEKRIVNRCVRPLLKAVTRVGALAHFFGRDWVSVAHRPAAWVGFAHDATTQRTVFEAFVAVRAPFHDEARDGPRPSLLGKEPGTLEGITGKAVDPHALVEAIARAYAEAWDAEEVPIAVGVEPSATATDDAAGATGVEPPWAATVDEAIGTIGAGRDAGGVFRVGGDLLVSRDALARLEARSVAAAEADLGRVVDETLAAPGVALDGVRSLESVRDVIARALSGAAPRPSLP
jgi:hypothetical protein